MDYIYGSFGRGPTMTIFRFSFLSGLRTIRSSEEYVELVRGGEGGERAYVVFFCFWQFDVLSPT